MRRTPSCIDSTFLIRLPSNFSFKIVSNCLLEEMDNQNINTAVAGCASPLAEQKPGLTGESARKSGKMKNFTWKLLEMRSGKCIFVIWSGGVR